MYVRNYFRGTVNNFYTQYTYMKNKNIIQCQRVKVK